MTGSINPPPSGPETGPAPEPYPVQPHRGTTILVLGILGLVVCCVLGIVAWVMGNNDLSEMRAGRMDPSGRGLTNAGRICGIVSVCLSVAGVLLWVAIAGLGGLMASLSHVPH
jgi:hypothetical protein